ncbi:MAG: hypothetical protein ABR591_03995, partial [Candidatus Velthaea sp.]
LVHGISRKDKTRMAAKTIDNVTVVFPAVENVPNTREPWVDVRVEAAHVWGVTGTALGRAESYLGTSFRAVASPVIDLVALR